MLNRPSHRHPRRHTTRSAPTNAPLDLDLIAQRVLKLAEIATLEHLEALLNSQADGLLTLDLVREVPEAMKPHKIAIGGAQPVIEDKKAA